MGDYIGIDREEKISIHALLAESDFLTSVHSSSDRAISIHALLAESDSPLLPFVPAKQDFYPRSPCGERRSLSVEEYKEVRISIHALLAESDRGQIRSLTAQMDISIHALLAESDPLYCPTAPHPHNFYPRSPCGERPRSVYISPLLANISIHALLAESDPKDKQIADLQTEFLSTLSLRRATEKHVGISKGIEFLSTLSLRRATTIKTQTQVESLNFYPRSPCGERLLIFNPLLSPKAFLSTLSLRRATSM